MTEEQKAKYKRNREARAEAADRKRAVKRVLEDIIINENTGEKEKMEAVHLLLELSKSYYY